MIIGKPVKPNYGIEVWYRRQLMSLVREMAEEAAKELSAVIEQFDTAQDASEASQTKIALNKLREKWTLAFADRGGNLAQWFVKRTKRGCQYAYRQTVKEMFANAAERAKLGFALPARTALPPIVEETVKNAINENVSLIKSIPSQYFDRISSMAYKRLGFGKLTRGQMEKELPFPSVCRQD